MALLILLAVSIPVSQASAAPCTKQHTVKANDSWTRLAARFNVPLKTLLSLNAANTATPLFIGDRVCISNQPVVTPPDTRFSRREVVAIIRDVWPDDLEETALFVARRESNFTPAVVGGKSDCCLGLFQIYWSVHRSWLERTGVTEPSQLLDPRTNAEAALALYRRNGNSWRPWWTSSWRP